MEIDTGTEQVSTTQPASVSEPNKSKIITILLILGMFLLGGLGGYFIGSSSTKTALYQKSDSPTSSALEKTISDIEKPSTLTEANENWTTYTDEKNRFQLTYPPSWTLSTFLISTKEIRDYLTQEELQRIKDGEGGISASIITQDDYRDLKNKAENNKLDGEWSDYQPIQVDGATAIQYIGYYAPSGDYIMSTLILTDEYQISINKKLEASGTVEEKIKRHVDFKEGLLTEEDKLIINDYESVISSFRFLN